MLALLSRRGPVGGLARLLAGSTVIFATVGRAEERLADSSGPRDLGSVPVPAIPATLEKPDDPDDPVDEDDDDDKRSGLVVVPLVLYAPEMHLAVGGFAVRFFRLASEPLDSRVSSLALVALVTTRKQLILELLPEIYWENGANHVDSKLEYQIFPDSFWGIGDRTPDADEERYTRSRLRFRGVVHRRIIGPLYAGLHVDAMWLRATYLDPSGTFATQSIPGEAGGVTNGLGPTLSYDTRDNAITSHSGTLLNVTFSRFDSVFGSAYDFNKLLLDARQFFPLGGEHALGVRFWGEAQGGNVPFFHLAMLGGDELLRGYFLGRYRDKFLAALEAEYRFPLFWRFGGVAFAGIGEVARSLTELNLDPIRWNVGGGGRVALNQQERLNLRLDVGFGYRTHGVYFSATEAF